ncbi:MAG: 3-phosphoserine/phosphohydroxythreonine transaminase [Firmicutes bacterium]|nr:3-phosphoserine/phosphohydroxythreonine transaminase [Bacillota bacterium]
MRVYNFSAGPAMMFEEVLNRVQSKFLNYDGVGMSVMEMSHRGPHYGEINLETERLLRELMNVPQNYAILFVQGGASTQFDAIPLNLNKNKKADYIVTGLWSGNAYAEAPRYTDAKCIASSEDKGFSYIPKITKDMIRPDADYLHYCQNNTIYGTSFKFVPDAGSVPLVNDLSSCILSEELDVSKFGVLYACAQKNIGPSGVTVVIVRKDLLDNYSQHCPHMLRWKLAADNVSMYNTPPGFSTYVSMEVFKYLKEIGGVKVVQKMNQDKAKVLYDHIDNSKMFKNNVVKEDRSIMNVPFFALSKDLDEKFIVEAEKNGLSTLRGHKAAGGMRASIYNAMPAKGVQALVDFMKKFEMDNR